MPVAPVRRIEEFGYAVVADRDVGRNGGGCSVSGAAGDDVKTVALSGLCCEFGPGHVADHRQWWCVGEETVAERDDRRWHALDLDEDGRRVVTDETGQSQFGGHSVDEGPEAHSLDYSGHGESAPL